MIIGIPKETLKGETRVAMTPEWTRILTEDGHKVLIETTAGDFSGYSDQDYIDAGAEIVPDITTVYDRSDFVAKVKELQVPEYTMMHEGQIVMTWYHLAEEAVPPMLQALLDSKVTALSMELFVTPDGKRPTMVPMSGITGALAIYEAIKYSDPKLGGNGIMLRKVAGQKTPKILIVGGGTAGLHAAQVAIGVGLKVTIIEQYRPRIDYLEEAVPEAEVLMFSKHVLQEEMKDCDVVINCTYIMPGHHDYLITREMVRGMKKTAMVIDLSGGGVVETTTKYSSLDDPIYFEEGIMQYSVMNMPSLVPHTASNALLQITGPIIQAIANKGLIQAAKDDDMIRKGISTYNGKLVHEEIAMTSDMDWEELDF